MRKTLLVGGALIVAAVLLVVVSDLFDLRLESTALLGLTVGAIVALVPDQSPALRLAGFATGLVVTWVSYLLRAGFLPDSVGGRTVAIVLVLVVCVAVAALTSGRVPLWSTLLGAAAMAGAYEYTYAAAPPEVTTTSVTAVTALLMTAGLGFLAAALTTPRTASTASTASTATAARKRAARDEEETTSFDDIMEASK